MMMEGHGGMAEGGEKHEEVSVHGGWGLWGGDLAGADIVGANELRTVVEEKRGGVCGRALWRWCGGWGGERDGLGSGGGEGARAFVLWKLGEKGGRECGEGGKRGGDGE